MQGGREGFPVRDRSRAGSKEEGVKELGLGEKGHIDWGEVGLGGEGGDVQDNVGCCTDDKGGSRLVSCLVGSSTSEEVAKGV